MKSLEVTKKNNRGRKQNGNITNNDMLIWIDKYTQEFPNEKIVITKLERFSGIDRHYWYDREGIKDRIDEVNHLEYEDFEIKVSGKNNELLELPDIDSLVDDNYKNRKKLKEILSHYFDVVQQFFNSSCEKYKLEREYVRLSFEYDKLKEKIEKIKEEKKKCEEVRDHYKEQLRTMTVRSKEKTFRDENNIKENVLDINGNRIFTLSTDNNEIQKMMDLLGD